LVKSTLSRACVSSQQQPWRSQQGRLGQKYFILPLLMHRLLLQLPLSYSSLPQSNLLTGDGDNPAYSSHITGVGAQTG